MCVCARACVHLCAASGAAVCAPEEEAEQAGMPKPQTPDPKPQSIKLGCEAESLAGFWSEQTTWDLEETEDLESVYSIYERTVESVYSR